MPQHKRRITFAECERMTDEQIATAVDWCNRSPAAMPLHSVDWLFYTMPPGSFAHTTTVDPVLPVVAFCSELNHG